MPIAETIANKVKKLAVDNLAFEHEMLDLLVDSAFYLKDNEYVNLRRLVDESTKLNRHILSIIHNSTKDKETGKQNG